MSHATDDSNEHTEGSGITLAVSMGTRTDWVVIASFVAFALVAAGGESWYVRRAGHHTDDRDSDTGADTVDA